MSGVRARFVRDVVDLLERQHGQASIASALDKLASRLGRAGDLEALDAMGPSDSIPLSDAEELLFGLDSALGDGSGKLLETASTEYFSRVIGTGCMAVPGDLEGTIARLRAPLEHVFIEQHIGFDIAGSSQGFSLFLGVAGRPRAARLLRYIAVGAVHAAQRFARQGMEDTVKVRAETLGERVRLDVHLYDEQRDTPTEQAVAIESISRPPVTQRNSRPHLASTQPTLDVVERIIARAASSPSAQARANNRRTDPVSPPQITSAERPPTRPSGIQRAAAQEKDDPDAEDSPTSKRSR